MLFLRYDYPNSMTATWNRLQNDTIRYTIEEFNVDSKAEYTA